jgi:ribose transport system permease protein
MIQSTDDRRLFGRHRMQTTIHTILRQRETALVAVMLVFGVVMTFASPYFLTPLNLEALLMGLSVNGIISVGMVIVIISGGLDLSVGSTMAFAGVVTGLSLNAGIPVPFAIAIGLAVSIGVGLINGILVAGLGINPFITTLGMMITVRGLLLIFSGGKAVLNLPDTFKVIGQGRLFGLQYPIYVMIIIVALSDFLLRNSRFLRQIYYIGNNENSAALSGIRVRTVRLFSYSMVAGLAGVAGLLITARFGSASVTVGQGLELRVITATIIGGASLKGGEGSVLGSFLGALFMGMLANSLNLLGVDVYWQNFITGITLILAIVIDQINERRKAQYGKQVIKRA